jgi:hypothetical protein
MGIYISRDGKMIMDGERESICKETLLELSEVTAHALSSGPVGVTPWQGIKY